MKKAIFFFLVLIPILNAFGQENKKVLVIGIDGCRPDALMIANTPNVDALIANGIYSPDALNDDITISGPGWSGNLCGVWSNKHLVTNNNFDGNNYEEYPSLFHYIEEFDAELHTASICHWAPINNFIISDTADYTLNVSTDAAVSSEASSYISNEDPDILFLHFDNVDHAGHSYGFSPEVPEYIEAIETVDALLAPIVQSIESRPTYNDEDWLILLTTDHGGINTSHGGNSIEEETVFFIASGNSYDTEVIEKELIIVDPPFNCLDETLELQFDGSDDYVEIPSNSIFDFGSSQDFTIECRLNTTTGGDVSIVGNKDWDTGLNPGFVLSFALPEGEQWKVNIGDGASRVDINTGGNIRDGEWHTISVSFDRDGLMKMSLNGEFVEQANISGVGNINKGAGLFFGADINSGYDFTGAIAEVRIWNTVLDEVSIEAFSCLSLDNSHPSISDLLGYWKLNDNEGTEAMDSSSNGNNGTVVGAQWDSPSSEEYDYSNTPRIVDVPVTALAHLCVPIEPEWDLDGQSWLPECGQLDVSGQTIGNQVHWFPNPVKDSLFLLFSDLETRPIKQITLYDMSGKELFRAAEIKEEMIFSFSQYENGIYFLKIENDSGFLVEKVVKSSVR